MKNNKLKYTILVLLIIVVILVIAVIAMKAGQPKTVFHTPWFDIVK